MERTVYLKEGFELHGEMSGSSFTAGPIKPQPIDLQVIAGDTLRLCRISGVLGHKAIVDNPIGTRRKRVC